VPSFESMHNSIRGRVAAAAAAASLPVCYDNDSKSPPTGGLWARATIVNGETAKIEIETAGTRRRTGVLVLQVFDDAARGDARVLQSIDSLISYFDGVEVSGVVFRTPSVGPGGEDSGQYRRNLTCPWYADQLDGA
jgi:hypothetical protein